MMLKSGTWNETCIRGRDRTTEIILRLVSISTNRANVTHTLARKQTPTQYSWFSVCHYTNHNALISTGNSMLKEQHANATVGQTLCCSVSHENTIGLSSSETSVEINRCFKTNIYCKHTLLGKHTCM
jgi:hypothetical protein